MNKVRLVIADDNAQVLQQVASMLEERFNVVARVTNGQDAVDATILQSPDLVVLDISMPVMTGLDAARQLRAKRCPIPIVFLTVHEDEEYLRAARHAGGLGYVLKSRIGSDLVAAIDAALSGLPFVSKRPPP